MPDNLTDNLVKTQLSMRQFIESVLAPLDVELKSGATAPAQLQEQVRKASRAAGFFYRTQPV